ncbi:TetR/AcrR family transcriptional regulator [Actinoplanes sp. RD1]|uniref:TetR/AcrR family transcriptional regulator n=1 Tax=Actinoplanes sp. RD1 TaxID=3064538 RepID=UPI0027411992|nr:TetR/AcrR family transcriptional regulator [Actinoplanes sp. RD1]
MRADAERNRAKILDAAEEVFAADGAAARTEDVARRAGVAVGTVFRHFATKEDLIRAIMKRLLDGLLDRAGVLTGADGLEIFFAELVAAAAARRTVVALAGVDLAAAMAGLAEAVARLLRQAQQAGAVRADVGPAEVMALLTSLCQGALHGGWDDTLQRRTLTIVRVGLSQDPRGEVAR